MGEGQASASWAFLGREGSRRHDWYYYRAAYRSAHGFRLQSGDLPKTRCDVAEEGETDMWSHDTVCCPLLNGVGPIELKLCGSRVS